MRHIAQLPPQLANQIAAGEVVERPASVVKELVENSLDAGATEVYIEIEKGGARRIRIRDNGGGIHRDQLTLALSRHATSKIVDLDDLEAITSLGFRGEALASISSVSRLTLTSKPAEQNEAWQAFCEGRDMAVNIEPASHPDGTTVDVADLFYNTPARRKFLRTEKTEFAHIEEVIRRLALAWPGVKLVLVHNQQVKRQYPAGPAAERWSRRMAQVGGRRFASEALALDRTAGDYRLSGWLARPEHCRHQNDLQYLYVNGRMMRDRVLSHALRQAYGEHLGPDRQPTCILYFELPATQVDVNVHPAKHEVRFHQSRQVHDFVLTTLREVLAQAGHAEATPAAGHGYQPPDPSQYQQPAGGAATETGTGIQRPAVREPGSGGPPPSAVAGTPAGSSATERATGQQAARHWQQLWRLEVPEQQNWQPLTLLRQRWLLLQQHDTLATIAVDRLQQAVQARRLEQQLSPGLTGQPLLLPTQLSYAGSGQLLVQYGWALEQLGILLRQAGQDRLAVIQVPAILRESDLSQRLPELFDLLGAQDADQPLTARPDVLHWLAQVNCPTAYSPDQAAYWWQQAVALEVSWTDFLLPLAWEPE